MFHEGTEWRRRRRGARCVRAPTIARARAERPLRKRRRPRHERPPPHLSDRQNRDGRDDGPHPRRPSRRAIGDACPPHVARRHSICARLSLCRFFGVARARGIGPSASAALQRTLCERGIVLSPLRRLWRKLERAVDGRLSYDRPTGRDVVRDDAGREGRARRERERRSVRNRSTGDLRRSLRWTSRLRGGESRASDRAFRRRRALRRRRRQLGHRPSLRRLRGRRQGDDDHPRRRALSRPVHRYRGLARELRPTQLPSLVRPQRHPRRGTGVHRLSARCVSRRVSRGEPGPPRRPRRQHGRHHPRAPRDPRKRRRPHSRAVFRSRRLVDATVLVRSPRHGIA